MLRRGYTRVTALFDPLVPDPLVRSLSVIVRDIHRDRAPKRTLAEEYHPSQALGLDRQHESLGEGSRLSD